MNKKTQHREVKKLAPNHMQPIEKTIQKTIMVGSIMTTTKCLCLKPHNLWICHDTHQGGSLRLLKELFGH